MKDYNPKLAKQVEQFVNKAGEVGPELQLLLENINETYNTFENQLTAMERATTVHNQEIDDNNAKLKAIISAIPDRFYLIDRSNWIISEKSQPVSGSILDSISSGLTPTRSRHLSKALSLPVFSQIEPLLEKSRNDQCEVKKEIEIKNDAGHTLTHDIRVNPIGQGELMISLRDTSDIKAHENHIMRSLERLERQNETLLNLTALFEHETDLQVIYENIVKSVSLSLNVNLASIWYFDSQERQLECVTEFDLRSGRFHQATTISIESHPTYFNALTKGRVIAAHDAKNDERTAQFALTTECDQEIFSILDAPIRSTQKLMGILCLEQTQNSRSWTADEQQFVASIADLIALVHERSEREAAQVALLESENRFKVLAESTDASIFAFDDVFLYANPAMEKLTGKPLSELRKVSVGEILGQPFVENLKRPNNINGPAEQKMELEIVSAQGETRWLYTTVALAQFEGEMVWLANAFDITERKLIESQLRYQAFHDKLTGLPNRARFIEKLDASLLRASRDRFYRFAVLFIDIDGFKVINDNLGHLIGDQLLLSISRRLRTQARHGDTVARLGSDEFTVLMDNLVSVDEIFPLTEAIQKSIKEAFYIDKHELKISVSIGIAFADNRYEKSEHILRDADIAMFHAKAKGKDCHEVFNTEMQHRAQKISEVEQALRTAVKRNQLSLHYQPIINLKSLRTASFEALIRWKQGKKMYMPPAEFIPLAEESGAIVPIGDWVLDNACQQIARWEEHFSDMVKIAINLSSRQFESGDLIDRIKKIIVGNAISPKHLQLELTESMIIDYSDTMLQKLTELRAMGCELIVDDFGTGYASLSYLNQFPIQGIKIDRSFVADLGEDGENAEVIKSIIRLAHNLGLEVIAKGVENATQLLQLKDLDCDYAQGFLFSEPVNSKCAMELVQANWNLPITELAKQHSLYNKK